MVKFNKAICTRIRCLCQIGNKQSLPCMCVDEVGVSAMDVVVVKCTGTCYHKEAIRHCAVLVV